MIENLTLLAVMTVTVCGFLVLAFPTVCGTVEHSGGLLLLCPTDVRLHPTRVAIMLPAGGSFYSLLSSLAGGAKRTVAVVVKRSDVMDFTITPGFDSRLGAQKNLTPSRPCVETSKTRVSDVSAPA